MPGKKNAEPAPAPAPATAAFQPQLPPMPRAKVFRLNDGGGWDDYGAGLVTVDYLEGLASAHEAVLAVIDPEDKEAMLLHRITPDDIYRRHRGTLISWSDPVSGMTLSLSFRDAAACSDVWDTICQVQRKLRPDS
uniref:Predicted protein n=1 Tax=Hordeum vulgare subsp. vulgare TaxID=112509 RepID=F2E6P4_HORVV|nr:predicted protein [Hordeum vulgare subsp. vulgare]